jgi:hypothetical protein
MMAVQFFHECFIDFTATHMFTSINPGTSPSIRKNCPT